jgi:hypothetical protein
MNKTEGKPVKESAFEISKLSGKLVKVELYGGREGFI